MSLSNIFSSSREAAYTAALLRSLKGGGVKFLRYTAVDSAGNVRAKIKPVDYLLKAQKRNRNRESSIMNQQVSIAAICFAGLPSYGDVMVEGTGLTAENVLTLQPDLSSLRILPHAPQTARIMTTLNDQYTDAPSPLDTRGLLQRLVQDTENNLDLTMCVGVELEFCLVDAATGKFLDDSVYANASFLNDQEAFIAGLHEALEAQEIGVELIHSESGPGQLEVVLEYIADPVLAADQVLWAQETIRSIAHQHGKKAIFLPKYSPLHAGNGMHLHLSLERTSTGESIFAMEGTPGELTSKGGAFVEGMLKHLTALMALSAPTKNSYRRIGKGCWTGSKVGWELEDKESGVRICSNLQTKEWNHVEYKLCDATANLYLTLAAILAAGLDGIQNDSVLRPALRHSAKAEALPGCLRESLDALENDTVLKLTLGPQLLKAYLALRRNEAERSNGMNLEDEMREALTRA